MKPKPGRYRDFVMQYLASTCSDTARLRMCVKTDPSIQVALVYSFVAPSHAR